MSALRRWGVDAAVLLTYLVAAVVLFRHLWADPAGVLLADNTQDHTQFEWMLTHATRVFADGASPIFSDRVNAPLGINLMANTPLLALALPLTPVTLLFGPAVTFAMVCTLALAGTAASWYLVLTHAFGVSRAAAAVGGAFLGFAPSMVSQSTGHPNIAGQFLVPLLVWAVFRMRAPGHLWSHGLTLAGLVVAQVFVNEEILLFTALAIGVFLLAYWPPADAVRAAAPKLAVTALVAGVLLAYPLWFQFFGPQAYHGVPGFVSGYSSDLLAYPAFARRSVLGEAQDRLAQGATEENSFFGWPLLLLVPVLVAMLWRVRAVRAVAVVAAVFGVLSLGADVKAGGESTGWTGPWALFDGLPLFDAVVPTRLALVVTVAFGVLVALAVEHLVLVGPRGLPWALALAVALVPLVPTPQPVRARPAVPAFFTDGRWESYLGSRPTVVPVPLGWYENIEAMGWATATGVRVGIVGGYYLAPDPADPAGRAIFGPGSRPTSDLLRAVADQNQPAAVSDTERAALRDDVAYWHATAFVLPDTHPNADALRATLDQLIGPGTHVAGVWLWRVGS